MDLAFKLRQRVERGDKFGAGDADMVKAAYAQAKAAYDDMQAFLRQNPGAASTEYIQSTTALMNAANVAMQGVNAGKVGASAPAPAPAPGAGIVVQGPQATAGSTHTVNININGRSGSINTASLADSQNLAAILQQLQEDKGRAA